MVDWLHSAKEALTEPTFKRAVKIAFGNDTDTTACVAGGIVGLSLGLDAIPKCWLGALRGKELMQLLLSQYLQQLGMDATVVLRVKHVVKKV